MRVTLPVVVRADKATRTATGLVAPYGSVGYTNVGRLRFQRGSITWPDDLTRVKLMDYHQIPPVAVAYCSALSETDAGQVMTFQFGSTDLATQALIEALDRTRDGLSVELAEYFTAADGETVTSSTGTAVALVPVPAFADARVTSVAAAHHHQEGSTMPETSTPEPAATAAATATATVAVTGPIVDTPPADPNAPAAPPADPNAPAVLAAAMRSWITGTDDRVAAVLAQAAGLEPARMPDGLGGGAAVRSANYSRAQVEAALTRVIRGESRHPSVEAALSDIINTNVYEVVGQDSYVGQLWSAKTYNRRFTSLLRQAALTSWRVKGWTWGVRPGGGPYAGDKAAIPSNSPTVLPSETEAARWAGGHDLDRKFRDFGDTEFLNAYFTAMTEDYAVDSDAVARAFILASASTPTGWDTLGAGKSLIYGAMLAGDLMSEQLDQDIEPDYYIVSRADFRTLLDVVDGDAPAFMDMFGVDPSKFIRSSAQTTGIVTAGLVGAGTWYELGGSPIRVEALDLVKGGVDEAFFGYYATMLNDSRGIVKVDLTA